jgi:hypothetical protein
MWWENTPIFGPNFANQSHTFKMMWKPRKFDAFLTSNIELLKRGLIVEAKQGLSNECQSNFTSMAKRKTNKRIRPNPMCFWEQSRCDGKIPPFLALILQTKVIRTNDVKTALFDAFHTSIIEPFETRLKRSNTPEYISLKPNKVYRTNISWTSLLWLEESQSL